MYSFDFLPNTTRHESKKVRQANTDNKGKLFVTVFANRSCTFITFIVNLAPRHPQLLPNKILHLD